jgi:predicted neutral ceramidase superfamily lipid hydrolase
MRLISLVKSIEMKVTENSNYGQYWKSQLNAMSSKKPNYFLVGLFTLLLVLAWYQYGLSNIFKDVVTIVNGAAIAFFLIEIVTTLMNKEFKRNKYITYLLSIATLTAISILLFSKRDLYLSCIIGLAFAIPGIIALTFIRIKFKKR